MLRFPKDFLTGIEQRALLFVGVLGLLGLLVGKAGIPALSGTDQAQPQMLVAAVKEDQQVQIDIRSASKDELMLLPGIGEKRAQDILDFRTQHQFTSVRDLLEIKGIGEKTLAKMLPLLLPIGPGDQALASGSAQVSAPVEPLALPIQDTPSAASKKETVAKSALTNVVNLNTAGLEELCTLPGIGEVKARAIIAYRAQNGPFASIDDIVQVKGIGAKTLEKIRHRLSL